DVLQLLVTVGPHRQLQPEARRNGVVDSQTQLVTLHNGSSADRPDAAHQVDEELVALTRPAPPEAAHEAALALAAVSLGLLATEAHVGARGRREIGRPAQLRAVPLGIERGLVARAEGSQQDRRAFGRLHTDAGAEVVLVEILVRARSEERRVGKDGRSWW